MRTTGQLLVLAAMLFLLGGCAACPECGSIRQKNEITEMFISETIVPDYRYYYNGEQARPKAILGVDKRYTLDSKFWTSIELTRDQLASWMAEIKRRRSGSGFNQGSFQGAEILDPQGVRIGIWYSRYDWGTFKFPGGGQIQASVPSFRGSGGFSRNGSGK